jgi:23S rRNA (adenine2030-N6)-methyltransferase
MLSYQHAYHAGNHADVLKHVVLLELLHRLTAKDKPLRYIETHAGAGYYDLTRGAAQKNREYESGIARLMDSEAMPEAVTRLVEYVRAANTDKAGLSRYPGSPALARAMLRPEDSAYLFEKHPAEHRKLAAAMRGDRRITVRHEDGLSGCLGLVPPPERRGLLFMDPAYERADEQPAVVDAVAKAHRRFPTGVMAVWYPVVERQWVARFTAALAKTGVRGARVYELNVAPDGSRRGLAGSGMIVVNMPWPSDEALVPALRWLTTLLEQGPSAGAYRAFDLG